MKKIIKNLYFIGLLVIIFSRYCNVKAETIYKNENWRYTLSSGEVSIYSYDGEDKNVVIPDKIDGFPVTMIGDYAFYNNINLEEITIPESVEKIGSLAFGDCKYLRKIYYNASNCESCIYGPAYYGPFRNAGKFSDSLEVYFGSSVNIIPSGLFHSPNETEYVRINKAFFSKSIKIVDSYAFYRCYNLQSIDINEGVRNIGKAAFADCINAHTINVPSTVEKIGSSAFWNCTHVKTINYDAENCEDCIYGPAYYGPFNNAGKFSESLRINFGNSVRYIPQGVFHSPNAENYIRVKEVDFSNSIRSIGAYAFARCYDLNEISLKEGLMNIGYASFEQCSNVTAITIPSSVEKISNYAFLDCTNVNTINYNAVNCASNYNGYAYNGAFPKVGRYSNYLKVIFGPKVKNVPKGLLYNVDTEPCYVTTIEINGPTYISDMAFGNCFSLTEVDINNKAATFSNVGYIFYNCSSGVVVKCYHGTSPAAYASEKGMKISYKDSSDIQLAIPQISEVKNSSNGVIITWGKVTGATRYRVYCKTETSSWKKVGGTESNSLVVNTSDGKTTLKSGEFYNFTVRCISSDGKSATSSYNKTGKKIVYLSIPKISSVKNNGSLRMTLKWKKSSGVTGYQIQFSLDKTFKSGIRTVNVKKPSTVSATVSKLGKKKIYYVRIRSYKTVGITNYYSAWSNKKSVKINK